MAGSSEPRQVLTLEHEIGAVDVDDAGRLAVVGSYGGPSGVGNLVLIDLEADRRVWVADAGVPFVTLARFGGEGAWIAFLGSTLEAGVATTQEGVVTPVVAHAPPVRWLSAARSADRLLLAGGAVDVLAVGTEGRAARLPVEGPAVGALDPQGERAAVVAGRSLTVHDLGTGAQTARLDVGPGARAVELAGEVAVVLTEDLDARVFDVRSGRRLLESIRPGVAGYSCARLDRDGEVLALGRRSGWVEAYRLPGGDVVYDGRVHRREVSGLAFAGSALVSASVGGSVRRLDL